MPNKRTDRVEQRMIWLLEHINAMSCRGTVAWDSGTVDAFMNAFPESAKSAKFYTMGPHSCPMLDWTARRAAEAGYLRAGVIGCQDARSYNQRTWARYWCLTGKQWR